MCAGGGGRVHLSADAMEARVQGFWAIYSHPSLTLQSKLGTSRSLAGAPSH